MGTQVHQDCAVPHLLILNLVTQIILSVYVVPVVVLSSLSRVMDKKHRAPKLVEFVFRSNECRISIYTPQSLIRKCRPMKTHISKCFRFCRLLFGYFTLKESWTKGWLTSPEAKFYPLLAFVYKTTLEHSQNQFSAIVCS